VVEIGDTRIQEVPISHGLPDGERGARGRKSGQLRRKTLLDVEKLGCHRCCGGGRESLEEGAAAR
jgi:hypothetical protein